MAKAVVKTTTKTIAPRKKKTVRVNRRISGYGLMPTDSWFKAKHFVHYEIESKDWVTKIKDHVKKNYDKKIAASINRLPDWKVGVGSHWATAAACLERAPGIVPEDYVRGLDRFITGLAAEGQELAEQHREEEKLKPKNVHVPTIQERIFEQSQEACEAIDEWLEGFVVDKKTFDPKGFDFAGHFVRMKVSQAHARKIKGFYESELAEFRSIVAMPTVVQIAKIQNDKERDLAEQFREGYKHLTKKDAQDYLAALETLIGACDVVIDASKATRKPRVKKAPSKERLIAKLKIKDRDDKLQIVSVNPLELLESTEVWVFNVKTRKLGRYVAAEDCSIMTVKGSTLVGFDETRSVQKTVRKPEETLKEFKKAGKVKLRTFLNDINAVEVKLNGRLGIDTVILRTEH
jgi:hypothetical protein